MSQKRHRDREHAGGRPRGPEHRPQPHAPPPHRDRAAPLHDAVDFEPSEEPLETTSRFYLEIRAQNLELLRLAARFVRATSRDARTEAASESPEATLNRMWDFYSALHGWIEPDLDDGDEQDE